MDDHSSWPAIACGPLAANPNLSIKAIVQRYRLADQTCARSLFGIAPDGACHAGSVARSPVGFYSTVSPLPAWTAGGLISVALSVGFPRPGVTWHQCFVESGLSSEESPAVIQPTAHCRPKRKQKRRQPLICSARLRIRRQSTASSKPWRIGAKCNRTAANTSARPAEIS